MAYGCSKSYYYPAYLNTQFWLDDCSISRSVIFVRQTVAMDIMHVIRGGSKINILCQFIDYFRK